MFFRRLPILFFFLMLAGSGVALTGCAAGADPALQGVIALTNARLIDGTGAAPLTDAVLLIQDGRILAVGKKGEIRIPPGAQVLDAGGGTILPGFINAHVHAAYDQQHLKAWLDGGVTTVRDEGIQTSAPLSDLMDLRKRASQDARLARLVSAGRMISVPNGYGSLSVTSPEDARLKVLEELNAGVDQVKISMEDGYAGDSGLPMLTPAELSAIISTAHAQNVRVSGHITQASYMAELVDAGVDDIAHLAYDLVPEETLQKMVDKNIYLVPTFTVFRNYNAPVETCRQNLANFVRLGGKVALGNDYNGGPGEFELGIPMYEIHMMSQSGMIPMEIIVASTRNAAHVVGLEKEIGTLEPGKIADVLVVNGNPLENLQKLTDPRMIIHNGIIVFPQSPNKSYLYGSPMLDLIFASHLDDREVTRIIRAYPAYSGLEARIGTLQEIKSFNPITYQAITSNGNFIFRFPPDLAGYHLLKKEEKIQKGFANRTNLRIPETLVYDDVNNFPVFAVHTTIPGKPLAASLYERLSPGARYRLITDLANFFNQAHRVPLTLACEWLDLQAWGDSTAEILAPVYGKPAWFEPKAVTSIGLTLSKVLDENQINLFNQTVELFEELDSDGHNLVFGHGDLHGYNMAIEEDEFGPKITGVFDLGCAGILDVHEDFFRLSLISEDLLERVIHIYQNFSSHTRILDRQRLAIYYRAFLFYLMAEQAEEDLQPLVDLLSKHVDYYENSYGNLR